MPLLDVSEPLTDPDFVDFVSVLRRSEALVKGSAQISVERIENVPIVITVGGDNKLNRNADEDNTSAGLTFVTKFSLRATAPGYKPDVVLWRENYYMILLLEPYPQYGEGFVQAVAQSIVAQDVPVETSVNG